MMGILMSDHMMTLSFITDLLAPWHVILIGVFALLIFGNRLPEVGRSLGRSIVEFKKGIRGIEDEVQDASKKKDVDRQIDQEKPYRAPLTSEGKDGRVSRGTGQAQEPVGSAPDSEQQG